jgi:hypothetical protein
MLSGPVPIRTDHEFKTLLWRPIATHCKLGSTVFPYCASSRGRLCHRSAALKHESRDHNSEVEAGIPPAAEFVVGMNDRIIDFARNVNR